MPFDLQLDPVLEHAGWKVKIHDLERLEPPHVTIHRKLESTWRLSLRDREFLDKGHKWSQITKGVRQAIEHNWERLVAEWNAMHPDNPVHGDENE